MIADTPQQVSTIDVKMVKHIAFLVRLGISATEARAFSHQFTSIIDYFHLLNEVNTGEVPPACASSNNINAMRNDEVKSSMPREEYLKNVPHRDGDYVQVPQIFTQE